MTQRAFRILYLVCGCLLFLWFCGFAIYLAVVHGPK